MKNILICLLLSSFASYSQKNILAYNIYYYKNPEHKIKQYENILVITNAHPKTYRLLLKAARKNKYKIILSDVLFPEQKKYSEKDVAKIIRDNNIDGILYYTILGTTSTEIDLGTHSTYTTPNKDGVGTIVTQQRTSTYKFTKIEATFIEPKSKHDTIFYCYGGIEGKSFAITYKAFDNILMKFKKIGVALPLEKDDSNKLIVSDETLKINEYLKYEEQALNDFENKKYNESILNYNKVIELSPNYIDAYFNRAKAKSELGDYEGSIVDNSKAIELKPDFSMAYNNRGWCKLLQKKHIDALMDFNKAIELDPRNAIAYNSRQEAKFGLNDFVGCMEDCNIAISIDDKLANSYLYRGKVHFKNGEKNKACENWSKAGQYGRLDAYELIKTNCN